MNRRKIFVTSTISMLVITIAVAGAALYTNFTAHAFVRGVPNAIQFFPVETQAVFGMNVQRFLTSPAYAQLMEKHEQEIGKDLSEFISRTGVDPRRDVEYIIGGTWSAPQFKGGVVMAVGTFNQDAIISYINAKGTPIRVDYNGATVLMFPEANRLQKGIAFLNDSEIALGDLDSLHAVLDVRYQKAVGIVNNAVMRDLLGRVGSTEMFWFAGDSSVLSRVPAPNASILPNLMAIQNVFGTVDFADIVRGKVSVTAKDATSAQQLADFAKGLIALGNLAGAQNPDLAKLANSVQVTQSANQFDVNVAVPFELLEKLHKPGTVTSK